eukprot:1059215-Amphidinium_carterae.1
MPRLPVALCTSTHPVQVQLEVYTVMRLRFTVPTHTTRHQTPTATSIQSVLKCYSAKWKRIRTKRIPSENGRGDP